MPILMNHSNLVQRLFQQIRSTEQSATDWPQLLAQIPLSVELLQELQPVVLRLHQRQPTSALRLAQMLHESSQKGSRLVSAQSSWILGELLLDDRQYRSAHQHLWQARLNFQELGKTDVAAQVGISLVASLAYCGDLSSALSLATEIEKALTRTTQVQRRSLRSLARLSLHQALVYELMGDPEQALTIHEHTLKTVMSLGNPDLLARLNLERARVLVQIHAFQEAISSYAHAEMLLHSIDNKVDLLRLYLDRVSLLIALQEYDEAAKTVQQAQQLLNQVEGMNHAASWLVLLRVQLMLARNDTLAPIVIDQLRQAQEMFAHQGPLIDECVTWLLLGNCEVSFEHWAEANRCYEIVLTKVQAVGERTLEFRALHGLSLVKRQQGETEEAILLLQLSIDKLELVRQRLQIETCRVAFLSDYLHFYQDLAQLYLQQKQWDRAFEIIERAKARVIGEKLALRLQAEVADAAHSSEPYVRQLAQQLQTALQQLQRINQSIRIRQAGDIVGLGASIDPTDEESTTLTTLEHLVYTLIMQIQYHRPRFSLLTTGQSVSLESLQEMLNRAYFVQYFGDQQNYCALLIDSQGICRHFELAPLQKVSKLHKVLMAAIERMLMLSGQMSASRLRNRLPTLLQDIQQHLSEFYELLFLPVKAYLPATGQLILSPDSDLHSLPFHAFYDGKSYLVERYVISYVPSATVFQYCTQNANRGNGILLCGYDDGKLNAVYKELRALVEIFPNATIKLAKESTATAFLHHAPYQQLIHIAAHASFRHDRPMLSQISFAERQLTLAEIANLNLCADLAGLSGCETGAGESVGGDILSLASGFLGAGVRALMASLWRVEDTSTAQVVEYFYHGIHQGLNVGDALRNAQLTMLNKARQASDSTAIFQHPAFWAPFVIIGDGVRSILLEQQKTDR